MKTPIQAFGAFLGLLLLSGAALAQNQVVGRVLLAAGDAFAVRNGQPVRLAYNSQVEFRDTLRTGAASSLQVRFVDESLLSLRENTDFQIEEYRFGGPQQDAGSERAFFRLIKGGFRSVTGLIGRNQNANYRVQTQTATIGIRGTDYAARLCAGDCGANVKDGLYGSVLGLSSGTNKVTITNEATPQQPAEFGINQHFYVSAPNASPQQLLQPPAFVSVRPQGRAQAAQQGGQGTGGEQASEAAGVSAESRPQSVVDASTPLVQAMGTTPYSVQNTAQGSALLGDVGLLGCDEGCGGGLGFLSNFTFTDQSGSPVVTAFSNVLVNIGEADQGFVSGSNNGGGVHNNACFGAAGCAGTTDPSFNAWIGRWNTGFFKDVDGTVRTLSATSNNVHYIVATGLTPYDAITAKSGTFSFSSVVGTPATNNFGEVAVSTNLPSVNVTFGANPSAVIPSYNVSFAPSANFASGQSYSFTNIPLQIKSDIGGKVATLGHSESVPLAGACTGSNCNATTFLRVDGAFVGALARHLGLTVETRNNATTTQHVRVFTCGSC